jgi:hypothetical protein
MLDAIPESDDMDLNDSNILLTGIADKSSNSIQTFLGRSREKSN